MVKEQSNHHGKANVVSINKGKIIHTFCVGVLKYFQQALKHQYYFVYLYKLDDIVYIAYFTKCRLNSINFVVNSSLRTAMANSTQSHYIRFNVQLAHKHTHEYISPCRVACFRAQCIHIFIFYDINMECTPSYGTKTFHP